jgi:hypothetical protein
MTFSNDNLGVDASRPNVAVSGGGPPRPGRTRSATPRYDPDAVQDAEIMRIDDAFSFGKSRVDPPPLAPLWP